MEKTKFMNKNIAVQNMGKLKEGLKEEDIERKILSKLEKEKEN